MFQIRQANSLHKSSINTIALILTCLYSLEVATGFQSTSLSNKHSSFIQSNKPSPWIGHGYPNTIITSNKMSQNDLENYMDTDDTIATDEKTEAIYQAMSIHVCSSTSCTKKRKILGMDEFATFGAMYERASTTGLTVEESTCLGSCKLAPCVAVQHEDYMGNIGLEGMTDNELSLRLFHRYVYV